MDILDGSQRFSKQGQIEGVVGETAAVTLKELTLVYIGSWTASLSKKNVTFNIHTLVNKVIIA